MYSLKIHGKRVFSEIRYKPSKERNQNRRDKKLNLWDFGAWIEHVWSPHFPDVEKGSSIDGFVADYNGSISAQTQIGGDNSVHYWPPSWWLIVNAINFPQLGVWALRIFTWKSSSFCWSLKAIFAQVVTCMLKNQGFRSQPVSIKLWDSESSWKLGSIEHPRSQIYLGFDQNLPVPIGSAIFHV